MDAGGYKLVLRDRHDVVLWTQDNYYQALDGNDLTNIEAQITDVEQQLSQTEFSGVDTGSADAYILATALGNQEVPTAYSTGMKIYFAPDNANTGPSTIKVGSLATIPMKMPDGSDLPANFLVAGEFYCFIYFLGVVIFFQRSGLVTTDGLDDLSVTTPKIANKAVTLAKVADATAFYLSAYDSGGVATTIANPMRLLASGSLTSTSSLEFILSTLQTAQSVNNSYLIRLIGFQPATDDQQLWMTISSDGGSSYLAGAGYYSSLVGYGSDANPRSLFIAGGSKIGALGTSGAVASLSNAAGETASAAIYLYNFNTGASLTPSVNINGSYWTATANIYQSLNGDGAHNAAADYDAVKFTWSGGGNFAAVGRYYIYALPNTI